MNYTNLKVQMCIRDRLSTGVKVWDASQIALPYNHQPHLPEWCLYIRRTLLPLMRLCRPSTGGITIAYSRESYEMKFTSAVATRLVQKHVPGSRLSHETWHPKQLHSRLGGSPYNKLWVLRADNSHTRDNSIRSKQRNKAALDFRTRTWRGHRSMRYDVAHSRSVTVCGCLFPIRIQT